MAAKTKGEKVCGFATVVHAGTGCVGGMRWETPYVVLRLADGRQVRWQSDEASGVEGFAPGWHVHVEGFLYGDHLRRVTLVRLNEQLQSVHYGAKYYGGRVVPV